MFRDQNSRVVKTQNAGSIGTIRIQTKGTFYVGWKSLKEVCWITLCKVMKNWSGEGVEIWGRKGWQGLEIGQEKSSPVWNWSRASEFQPWRLWAPVAEGWVPLSARGLTPLMLWSWVLFLLLQKICISGWKFTGVRFIHLFHSEIVTSATPLLSIPNEWFPFYWISSS